MTRPPPGDVRRTPHDLEAFESRLDGLAGLERARTPEGLSSRIAAATFPDLASAPVAGRIGFGRAMVWGGALAAAAAVLVAVPLLLLGGSPPGGGVPSGMSLAESELEQDLETFAYVAALYEDDWNASWSDGLERVSDRAENLDSALDDPWAGLGEWLDPASDT